MTRIVKHVKRGSTYEVIGTGHLNTSNEQGVVLAKGSVFDYAIEMKKIAFDREEVTIYRDRKTGALSARPTAEFEDGRFVDVEDD